MASQRLKKVARMIVETSMGVKAGENVCVVTDTNRVKIAEVLADECKRIGAETVVTVMTPRMMHGNEPPKVVAAAMKAADVVLAPTTYAITHTDARLEASKAGARVLILRGITEEIMTKGAMTADYGEVRRLTEKVAKILSNGSDVRVTSKEGADVTFSIAGREALVLAGFYDDRHEGGFCVLPDGEAPIAPVEGTAQGTIVVDYSMDGIGLLDRPIRIAVSNGKAESIDGGRGAKRLREILKGGDENATNVAEFAIGTNSKARLIGNLAEDKKYSGSVHFALGDNHAIGGIVSSNIHVDGMIVKPTVEVDAKLTVKNGKITI